MSVSQVSMGRASLMVPFSRARSGPLRRDCRTDYAHVMPEWLSWLADWWSWCYDVFVWHPGGEDIFVITLVGHVLGIALFLVMTGAAAVFWVKLVVGVWLIM